MQKRIARGAGAFASASLIALAVAWSAPAFAQAGPGTDEGVAVSDEEIVVTGTLIRGIAPTGTNVVQVSKADVVATGAANTTDLLATIPQLATFNTIPRGTANFGQPIASTNLRGLGASGGTTTLTLMNGHRVVGSGVLQTYVDPTIIPPGIIERVEVIPDGGSSIYGSDAIGGVINFITRKRFDGVEATGKYGWADGYQTVDANVTVGKDWGSGSLSLSYAYAWHNNIQGIERDYVTDDNRANGGTDQRLSACPLTNITVAGVNYALPGRVAGTQNRCDRNDYNDIYPREHRHTLFGTLDQDLSDTVNINVTGYWSTRRTLVHTAPLVTSNAVITSSNPFFSPIGAETFHLVSFNYTSAFGLKGVESPQRFDSWGFTPTLTFDLGGSWQLRAMGNYGHSYNETNEFTINNNAALAALAGTTTATALNPYNLGATNPSVLAGIRDYVNRSVAKQELANARVVADGTLLSIGGGDVRLALGAEYIYENTSARIAFGPPASPKRNAAFASRNVKSIFGEVFIPIVGADNAMGGIQALELTGSIRHDSYNDVGSTTNPKVGFNYRPVEGITIRGNYGTSFHAPSLADTAGGSVDTRVTSNPFVFVLPPGTPAANAGRPILFISGGSDLRPETAKTWSLGVDLKPKFVPGLVLSATYYNINFRNGISVATGVFGLQGPSFYTDPNNARFFILNPTLQQAIDFSDGARADNFDSLAAFFAANVNNPPFAIYDVRRYNLNQQELDGIDFSLRYNRPTSFGSINASFEGSYALNRKARTGSTGAFTNQLKNGFTRLNFVATAGATVGPVTGRATLTHSGGYPILGDPTQARVKSYNPIDLYFALDLEKMGVGAPATLTLNVDNVLDDDPPYRNDTDGYANGSTFGRLISVGLRTKF